MVDKLEPVIYNDTIKHFNENVPNMLKLINTTTEILERKVMQSVINKDTFIKDVFTDENKAENILTSGDLYFNTSTARELLSSKLR